MSEEHHPGSADTQHDQHVVEKLGYEARDIIGNRRSIFYFAAFHFGGLLLSGAAVYGIYMLMANLSQSFDGDAVQGGQVVSEAAKIQANPGPDMDAYLHKAVDRLNNYGWANEEAGVAHIPIEKAMEQVAESNLPHRPESTR